MKTKTINEIAAALRRLSKRMIDLGVEMNYYGGLNVDMAQHGRELVGAGMIAKEWAGEIESETGDKNGCN
jgi:hypothetical protein